MATYRIHKERNFVQIDKAPVMDQRLSWKAKGILTYLISRPDDWQVYESEVVKHSKDGKDSTRSGIKELMDFGYIKREEKRDERGRFQGYEYHVYEVPIHVGKSENGESHLGKPATTNNDITNNERTNNYKRYTITSNSDHLLKYYNDLYVETFNKEHPTVTEEQLHELMSELYDIKATLDMDDEEMKDCIYHHFANLPNGNDGKVFSFVNEGVIFRYTEEIA